MSDQVQHKAAITIQRHVRGMLVRTQFKQFVHNLKSRKYVANEILSSERSYVRTLNMLVNVFYRPLKESKVVDASVIKCIFGNIVEIQSIHVNLLKEMNTTQNLHLGSVFVKCIPTFGGYRAYVANYTTSLTTYNAWLEKKSFADRVKACCGTTGIQPSDLPGLLNQPVTQLARYKLLLEDLLAKTNPQNDDFENLQKAVVLLKQIEEGGPIGETPRAPSPTTSTHSSVASLQSSSSSASLARKINAIAQAPHNLPYKLSPFVSRSVSSTPVTYSPAYDPGDPSLPSYLRPTHTSYARSNEGRAKKDQVTYLINNTPMWMPNGNPHSEKIYNTPYNAIPYTPRQSQAVVDRSPSGKTWLPTPATPRAFDNPLPLRSSSSLSMRESPQKSPSKNKLNSTFTPSSSSSPRKPIPESPSSHSLSSSYSRSSSSVPSTPTKTPPSTPRKTGPSSTTPSKSVSTPKTPTSKTTPSTPKTPSSTSMKTPSKSGTLGTSPSKSNLLTTTPSKTVAAARAAGSHIPLPKTPSSTSKSGAMPKTPSQNGTGSKIPVLIKSPSTASVTDSEEHVTNGNGVAHEEEEDETMMF